MSGVVTLERSSAVGSSAVVPLSGQLGAWSAHQVIEQVCLIQEVKAGVMRDGEHYGTIPGTEKPTLLKSGAEKLALTFRLAASYQIATTTSPMSGHREYAVTCTLTHLVSGAVWGQGVGLCSTMESKYRYRSGYDPTGKPVPKDYWKDRDASLLGGKGFAAKKIEGQWQIVKATSREENPDIADTYNTVLKMAKKRAFVDAILTATGGSDFFTQDLEELAGIEEEKAPVLPVNTMPHESAPVQPQPAELTPPAINKPSVNLDEERATGVIAEVVVKDGVNAKTGKPWTKYGITLHDGTIYGTFDRKLGEEAQRLIETNVEIFYKRDGKYLTCTGVNTVEEPPYAGMDNG